jgi:hypothetical protein
MKTNDDQRGTVPEWLVERLAAGDLPPARAQEIAARLAAEPDGAARLAELRASNASILEAHPAGAVADEILRRVEKERRVATAAASSRSRSRLLLGAPALAAAAIALALWARPGAHPGADDGGDRPKGLAPQLNVYRRAGSGVERLASGAAAHAGDELQLAYVAAGKRYGAVVSLDGAGRVTFHLPVDGGRAVALQSKGEVTLPQSYQLDAAPSFERFLLVVGDDPFDAGGLADVIRGSAPPPAGTKLIPFTVRKE